MRACPQEVKNMQNEYSVKDIKATQRIRGNYTANTESDVEALRRLDKKVRHPADIAAYTVGTASALVLGTGMCICMGALGAASLFPLGVVVGAVGIVLAVANYFIYRAVLKRRKAKYAADIVALSDKILAGGGHTAD